jgi:hypothetical protein
MAYDLQEQEQIDSMKAFWQQWGKLIGGGTGHQRGLSGLQGLWLLSGSTGQQGCRGICRCRAGSPDAGCWQGEIGCRTVAGDYAGTAYAADAALLAAKVAFEKNDPATAQAQLGWVCKT